MGVTGSIWRVWGHWDLLGEHGYYWIWWENGFTESSGRAWCLWDLVKECEDHWIQWKSSVITGIQWKSMRIRLSCAAPPHTHRDYPETWALYQLPSWGY